MRAPVKLLGGYTQIIPSNWKLYVENTRDSYHASLLHMFFTTFRLNRLSQKGGLVVSESGGNHVSYSMRQDVAGKEYEQAGMRTAHDGYALEAPELLENIDEFGDGIGLQILTVFPGFLLQQIRNCAGGAPGRAARPRPDRAGVDLLRLYHRRRGDDRAAAAPGEPVGPAGFISLEDGAATGFVQRGTRGAGRRRIRRRDGRQRHRVGGKPRQRGRGARLLEGLPPPHGDVKP